MADRRWQSAFKPGSPPQARRPTHRLICRLAVSQVDTDERTYWNPGPGTGDHEKNLRSGATMNLRRAGQSKYEVSCRALSCPCKIDRQMSLSDQAIQRAGRVALQEVSTGFLFSGSALPRLLGLGVSQAGKMRHQAVVVHQANSPQGTALLDDHALDRRDVFVSWTGRAKLAKRRT